MTAAAATSQPLAALLRTAGGVVDAWRAITVEQIGLAALLGFASLAQVLVRALNQSGSAVVVEVINAQLGAFALLLAVVVADRAADAGAARLVAYSLAVLVGAIVGLAAQIGHLHYVWEVFDQTSKGIATFNPADPRSLVMRFVGLLIEWLLIDALAVYVYADWRAARQVSGRLHAATLERDAQARRVLESQLQAMQARVEPQFLFNTLAQVKRLYDRDPALGQRMLDELIAYLRAAMPQMRDTSSTLAQEVALARAYLAIVRLRFGDGLAFEFDVPEGNAIRMAPMMLLPLIDHAVARGAASCGSGATLRIIASLAGGKIRFRIIDSGAGFVPEPENADIASLRERLVALHGNRASLELRRGTGASTEAVLELPHEADPGTDR